MLKELMEQRNQLVNSLHRVTYNNDREMMLEEIAKIDEEIEGEKRRRGIFKE